MFGIGAQEIVVIAVIALIIFGPERLPELAAQLAKALRDMRRLSDELTGEFQRSLTSDAPAAADQESAAGATEAPATPDEIGSAIARSLRVETVPDEPSIPRGTAQGATGDRPHDDATIGRASLAGTTEAGPRIGYVGDTDPANVPPECPGPGPLPRPMSADGPVGRATAPATTGQAGAVGAQGADAARDTPRNPEAPGPPARPGVVEHRAAAGAMTPLTGPAASGPPARAPGDPHVAAFRERRRATYRRPRR